MSLAELFRLEPAPIYGQFVKRVEPLGAWPEPGKPRGAEHMRAMRLRQVAQPSTELVRAIRSGIGRGEAMQRFGITSSTYYRLRDRYGIRELPSAELDRVRGGVY